MTASPSLMACPFCGGSERVGIYDDNDPLHGVVWFGRCLESGCGGEVGGFRKRDEAIAAWNRRATPPLPAGFVAVPSTPTREMIAAADEFCERDDNRAYVLPFGLWQAMLAASPPPSAEASAQGGEACSLGVGCDEAGVCFAVANERPEQCGRPSQAALLAEIERLKEESASYARVAFSVQEMAKEIADELRAALAGVKA